jgi:RNA recognition motif-containing protein
MSKKLFIGGLSWNTTEHDLRQSFEKFGHVEDAIIITDRETGRSRGFGFVTFSDEAAAMESISMLNGTELDGRTINVNEAEERRQRTHNGGGRGNKGDWNNRW